MFSWIVPANVRSLPAVVTDVAEMTDLVQNNRHIEHVASTLGSAHGGSLRTVAGPRRAGTFREPPNTAPPLRGKSVPPPARGSVVASGELPPPASGSADSTVPPPASSSSTDKRGVSAVDLHNSDSEEEGGTKLSETGKAGAKGEPQEEPEDEEDQSPSRKKRSLTSSDANPRKRSTTRGQSESERRISVERGDKIPASRPTSRSRHPHTPSGQGSYASSQQPSTQAFMEQQQMIEKLMRNNDDLQRQLNESTKKQHHGDCIEMLQKSDGDTDGLELLEHREEMCKRGSLARAQVLDPFKFVLQDSGMHAGHIICRNGHYQCAIAFSTRWPDQWAEWMNTLTFTMKSPMRWSPLMCFMEHTRPQARNVDEEHANNMRRMIAAMVHATTMETLMNTAANGGTFVHLARSADFLWFALQTILERGLNFPEQVVNVVNVKGHAPLDQHWNNRDLKEVIKTFKGVSIKPLATAYGKGTKGSGKGKGNADGLGPEHPWNRKYHNQ
jgi:hypothetical protein